jgi:hypothetical protein
VNREQRPAFRAAFAGHIALQVEIFLLILLESGFLTTFTTLVLWLVCTLGGLVTVAGVWLRGRLLMWWWPRVRWGVVRGVVVFQVIQSIFFVATVIAPVGYLLGWMGVTPANKAIFLGALLGFGFLATDWLLVRASEMLEPGDYDARWIQLSRPKRAPPPGRLSAFPKTGRLRRVWDWLMEALGKVSVVVLLVLCAGIVILVTRPGMEAACALGWQESCRALAYSLHDAADATPEELIRAKALYRAGCESGDGVCCHNLGVMELSGRGGPICLTCGDELFARACKLGLEMGCEKVRLIESAGTLLPALLWLKRSAEEAASRGESDKGQ